MLAPDVMPTITMNQISGDKTLVRSNGTIIERRSMAKRSSSAFHCEARLSVGTFLSSEDLEALTKKTRTFSINTADAMSDVQIR